MPSVHNLLAERTLFIVAPGRESIPVPIRLHQPLKHRSDWSCTYEIQWPKKRRRMAVFGVDALQALILALEAVASELHASRYHADGTLVWKERGGGYGFPLARGAAHPASGVDRN